MKTSCSMDLGTLKALLETVSPSSAEEEVYEFVQKFNAGCCALQKDALGNTYLKNASGSGPVVMIAAHCDEIGLQVVHITPEGYVRFRAVGGVDAKATAGRRVVILSAAGKVPGVICKVPIHVEMKDKTTDNVLSLADLWIDIGCSSQAEASALVAVGDMISFVPNYQPLAGGRISSKALDNKLGVFIAASALKRLAGTPSCANQAVGVLTVQEEVGCKGAAVAAQALSPSWGICIDVGVATDCPGVSAEKYGDLALGKGPGLSFCTDTSRALTAKAAGILDRAGIPFQRTVGLSATGGTDTMRMQVAGNGVPCVLLSIPLRSMHTPSEVCDLEDVSAAIDAVVELVKEMSL